MKGPPAPLPAPALALADRLAAWQTRWSDRQAVFRQWAPPPWWAPDVVITPDMRAVYEAYLPVREFLHDLGRVAEIRLPAPAWVPQVLRSSPTCGCGGLAATPYLPASLPDLWADLPAALAGRLTCTADELLPLLCALAAPPRYGTRAGRYPQQLAHIGAWLAARAPAAVRVLDVGCGTGHGTFELAAAARQAGARRVDAVGITREPLEVWMAARRTVPHDPQAECELRSLAAGERAEFAAGEAAHLPVRGPFDLVVANGLVGGPFVRTPQQVGSFLAELARVTATGALVSFANRFHDGWLPHVTAAAQAARAAGWRVEGDARLLILHAQ